jgi:hypothetical protein
MSVTFNHGADTFHESLGVSRDEFASKLSEVLRDFFNNTPDPSLSKLSELIYNRMSDAELLMLASNEVIRKLDEMEEDVAKMEKIFKNLFSEN